MLGPWLSIFLKTETLSPAGGTFGPEADGLELIVGNEVYLVDLGDGTNEDSGSLTLAATVSGTNIGDGFVSVADFNGNKKADVAVMSGGNIYIWEPYSQTLLTPTPYNISNTNYGGRINIGDFNSDGDVELGAAGRNIYVALDFDANTGALTELWTKPGLQDGSQRTGSTLFDFEGDGVNEIVYSDETTLYIWRGSDGFELANIPSASGTRTEYPLVADVNGDDQAEIIIVAQGTPGPGNSPGNGVIEVYRALNRPWITARKIWNQHGYFVTNVNDDGTIPAMQQDPILAGVNNVFNRFLVQTTILKQNGIPTYAAPNAQISFDPNTDIDLTNCPTAIAVTVTIYNTGSASLPEGVYVTFFDGDPFNGTPPVLHVAQTSQVVSPGGSTTLTATFAPPGSSFQLFVLVNHDGSNPNASLPISPPENLYSGVGECDYTDNSTNGAIDITGCSLTVTPCPDLAQISPVNQCAASFDLATVTVTDNNNTSGTLSYYTSSSDAYAATNALSSTVVTASGSYYVRKDANGCYDVAEIKLTLNCTPTPQDDNLVVNINTSGSGNLLANDTDPDGDPLTAMPGTFSTAQGGTLVINTDGSYTYTPPSGYTGADSYVYTACDDDGACATATLNIKVNSPPVANDDALTVNEDTPGSGDLSGNDSDVDGTLTYTSGTYTTAQGGSITINPDGTYTYTPAADYNGPDSYTYTVCDDDGACVTATLNITVNDVNDPPVANDDALTVNEDTPGSGDLSGNDSDVDGTLTYTSGTYTTAQGGSITINPDGTYTYTPAADYNGPDSYTYTVCDDDGACVTATLNITVTPVNDPPVAEDDNATVLEDTPLNGDLSSNDSDVDGDPLTYTSGTFTTTQGGTITINPDGTYTYTPPADYTGTDCYTYEVCDSNGACDNATICIEVTPNQPPIAEDDTATTVVNTPVDGSVADNDSDPEGDPLTYTSGTFTTTQGGTITINPDGTYTYTPPAGYTGTDCYTYEVCDNDGNCSNATLCVEVGDNTTVVVPPAITPNGDGINDILFIEGIQGKRATLRIFNRWGNVVYENDSYQNDWDGRSNQGVRIGETLPDGTYFYTIEVPELGTRKAGYITLKR